MPDPLSNKDYSTEREMEFLKSIRNNKKALEGYLLSCEQRVTWGFIKKAAVLDYAKVLLGSCDG